MKLISILFILALSTTSFAKTDVKVSPMHPKTCQDIGIHNWVYSAKASETSSDLEVKFYTDFATCKMKGEVKKRTIKEINTDNTKFDSWNEGIFLPFGYQPEIRSTYIVDKFAKVVLNFNKAEVFEKSNFVRFQYSAKYKVEAEGMEPFYSSYRWFIDLTYNPENDTTTVKVGR